MKKNTEIFAIAFTLSINISFAQHNTGNNGKILLTASIE